MHTEHIQSAAPVTLSAGIKDHKATSDRADSRTGSWVLISAWICTCYPMRTSWKHSRPSTAPRQLSRHLGFRTEMKMTTEASIAEYQQPGAPECTARAGYLTALQSTKTGPIRVLLFGVEKCERVYVVCLPPYTRYLSYTPLFRTPSGDG